MAARPVGATLAAEVTAAYADSYVVTYEGGWSFMEGEAPAVGSVAGYEVVRHLDTTRRTLLRPAGT